MPPLPSKSQSRQTAAQRGYGWRWSKARASYLLSHPLCVMCEQIGRVVGATVVDHIRPHKGDQSLFWNQDNWQPLCKHCHDAHKQAQESSGLLRGCATDGTPLDKGHHWHA